jgi:hypothetical protein
MSSGFLSFAFALGCTNKDDPAEEVERIDGVAVEENENNPMSAWVVLTPTEDLEGVTVAYGAGDDFDFHTPEQTIAAGVETRILVLGLEHDTDNKLRLEATKAADGAPVASEDLAFRSGTLTDGFPIPEIMDQEIDFPSTEVACSNASIGNGDMYCMDRQGRPRWILRHPLGQQISTFRPLRNGNFAGVTAQDVSTFDPSGARVGSFAIADASNMRFEHQFLDPREVIELTEGPWEGNFAILTATEDTLVDGTVVKAHGIVVFDPLTNEVRWDWSMHGELGDSETIDEDMLQYDRVGLSVNFEDWDHSNALLHGVEDNGDQFFWVSMRHQDWIVKVDCETDQIEWRFGRQGDFVLQDENGDPYPDDSWYMYQQHAPEWQSHGGGRFRFLVFDNGESRMTDTGLYDGPKYTRILEFQLDENTMTARKVWDYGSPDLDDPAHFYSVDHGTIIKLQSGDGVMFLRQGDDGPFLQEVSYPGGELRWRATYTDGSQQIYRSDWFPSLYETAWWYEIDR